MTAAALPALGLAACSSANLAASRCLPGDAPSLVRLSLPTEPAAEARTEVGACLGIPAARLPQFTGQLSEQLQELVSTGQASSPAGRRHFTSVTVPQLMREYGK